MSANRTNNCGRTALSLASACGYENIVDVLLEAKSDAQTQDVWGWTAAKWTDARGHTALAASLKGFEQTQRTTAATTGHTSWRLMQGECKQCCATDDAQQPEMVYATAMELPLPEDSVDDISRLTPLPDRPFDV